MPSTLEVRLAPSGELQDVLLDGESLWPIWFKVEWKGNGQLGAKIAGHRLTKDGVIVIVAQEHRDQSRNRAEARERLFDLIRQAAVRPTVRRATKVPKSAKRERLESKKRRSGIKSLRQRRPNFD